MRPVNKGTSPKIFSQYREAAPYLEQRLGRYCSYCEMPLCNAPEVEHIESRLSGGAECDWNNMLLSCKYCNTRKGTKVAVGQKEDYLWPDEDDTFHAFSYTDGIPKLNIEYMLEEKYDEEFMRKARNLFQLVQLDYVPKNLKERDNRFVARNNVYGQAKMMLDMWKNIKLKLPEYMEQGLELIVTSAANTGFFSCWMEVFKNEITVKKALIHAFPGTREEYCY